MSSTWQGLAYGEQLGPCRVEGHAREGTVLAKIGIQLFANFESRRQQMWACQIQPVIPQMESLLGHNNDDDLFEGLASVVHWYTRCC